MIGWTLNLIYAGLLAMLSPWLVARGIARRRRPVAWREKLFGQLPARENFDSPLVWFHAVSVGEVLLLKPLVEALRRRGDEMQIVVTTTTPTGHAVAIEKLPGCLVTWMPLDFTWSVRRALRRVRPDLVVLVELELWPNFIRSCRQAEIPLTLINGRLSDRSFRGYHRLRPLMTSLWKSFAALHVQTDDYARRFIGLGAEPEQVHVTGSIKFDGVQTDRDSPAISELRRSLGIAPHEQVFIAGSTIAPEEEMALASWIELQREFPDLRLIVVPRHRERFDEVAALIASHGLPLVRRSKSAGEESQTAGSPPVVLLDTLGELSTCWGLADFAFVGGSLTPRRGGQNMIEPAAFGAAVMFGPHTRNFRSVVESLLAAEAARVVRDGEELTRTLRELLNQPWQAARMGQNACRVVLAQQGATERTVDQLVSLLSVRTDDVPQRRAG